MLPMSRRAKILWMHDILDHLTQCLEQYEETDQPGEALLTQSIRRDLDELRRLCESLREMAPADCAAAAS